MTSTHDSGRSNDRSTALSRDLFLHHLADECARTHRYLGAFEAADMDTPPAAGMMSAREMAAHVIGCLHWLRMAAVHGDGDFAHFKVTLDMHDGAGAAAHYREYYRHLRDELQGLSEEAFNRPITMFRREMTVPELCLELAAHDVHHRGQLAVALRVAGRVPPDIFKASPSDLG